MKTKEKTPHHRLVTRRLKAFFSSLGSPFRVEFVVDRQPPALTKSAKAVQIRQVLDAGFSKSGSHLPRQAVLTKSQ